MTVFVYALKAPETRRQYPRRFKVFLDFLKLNGALQDQAKQFLFKARQNLQCNAELRNKDNKFFNPQPGEKSIWINDAEKIQPVEKEFDGKKVQRFQYIIQDPNNSDYETYWTVGKRTSEQIDVFLSEGHSLLKIQRISSGKEMRYNIMPPA
jgi:hypothetical protein